MSEKELKTGMRPPSKETLPVVIPALFCLTLITILSSQLGFPEPFIHDEFAYLLGADTFLEGRLKNATPAGHAFFETFHVSFTPTYHSKYPPGQSMFLAAGKLLFGREIYGVWLSFIAASMAVLWALRSVFSIRWALLGTGLLFLNATLCVTWSFSFWGGSVALLGGALFMGGLLRVFPSVTRSALTAMCVGLFVMAFSRPMEGLISAAIPLLAYVLVFVLSKSRDQPLKELYRVMVALAIVGGIIVFLNLTYNWILTGSPFRFPHTHWKPSGASHEVIQSYRGSYDYGNQAEFARLMSAFTSPYLLPLYLLALQKIRDIRVLVGGITVVGVCVISVLTSRGWPHYVAPVLPMMIGLTVVGAIQLSSFKLGGSRAGLTALLVLLLLHADYEIRKIAFSATQVFSPVNRPPNELTKTNIDTMLQQQPGNHLVFVRYLEGHDVGREYVYNRADIPSSKVIWAREMTYEKNKTLCALYPERHLWLLHVRTEPIQLESYDPARFPKAQAEAE